MSLCLTYNVWNDLRWYDHRQSHISRYMYWDPFDVWRMHESKHERFNGCASDVLQGVND